MRRNLLPLALACALASGCVPGKDGIWVFFIPQMPAADCEPVVTNHNYIGGSQPDDTTTSDWTEETAQELSDGVVFVQIFDSGGGDEKKVAVIDNRVYLGTKEGGLWHFEWDNFAHTTDSETHTSGYTYRSDIETTISSAMELDIKGDAATGTLSVDIHRVASYTESDTWAPEVGRNNGETPVDDYLVDVDDIEIDNEDDVSNCSASPCTLVVTTECGASTEVEGHQTNYQPDGFDGIEDAGQPAGTGGNN